MADVLYIRVFFAKEPSSNFGSLAPYLRVTRVGIHPIAVLSQERQDAVKFVRNPSKNG